MFNKGRVLTERSVYDSDGQLEDKIQYSHNKKGQLVTERFFNEDDILILTYEYKYDKQRNIIERKSSNPDGQEEIVTYAYIYDSRKNWIRKDCLDKDYPYIIERQIEYYGPEERGVSFMPSLEKNATSELDSEAAIEFYDSISNIYSNKKFGFSIKFPYGWSNDRGVSEHTIIRGYQEKNGASFSVNVIEVDVEKDVPFSMWKFYDENSVSLEKQFRNGMEDLYKTQLLDYSIKKVYIHNNEAIQRDFVYNYCHLESETLMKVIMCQTTKPPFAFTIGIQLPLTSFKEDPVFYSTLISEFKFVEKK